MLLSVASLAHTCATLLYFDDHFIANAVHGHTCAMHGQFHTIVDHPQIHHSISFQMGSACWSVALGLAPHRHRRETFTLHPSNKKIGDLLNPQANKSPRLSTLRVSGGCIS